MALTCMSALVSLPAPSPGPGQATCSKQKQDIGNGKEDVFWCSHALRRTYHCEGVTGPRPAVGCKYVCTRFSPWQTGEGQDLVTLSHRTLVLPPRLLVLATPTIFNLETFALRVYSALPFARC